MRVGYLDVLTVLIAYIIGSVPFSFLIARWVGGVPDIRERGEGSVGARNVYHVVGPKWGILAALLDIGKGLAVYLFASAMVARWGVSRTAMLACGFAAPLGHNFSPFLRFRGGKGVATTCGFLIGYLPYSALAGAVVAAIVYLLTRDMNKVLVLAILVLIVTPPLFGAPLWSVPYTLFLFLQLGVKKLIDAPHEREVWARDPWKEGRPGFHRTHTDE